MDDALDMSEAKEKLRNIRLYLPHLDLSIRTFCSYLADRLNPELVPLGFLMAIELAIYDLRLGVNGFTQQRISNGIEMLPPVMYALMRGYIPDIADAVFPADFAAKVKQEYEATQAKMRAT